MISRPISFNVQQNLTKARWLAPFSKRYACIASLQSLPSDHALIIGNCVTFNEGSVVFIKNHKAACTTISQLLYLHQNGIVCEDNVHKDYERLIQGLPNFPVIVEALMARNTFKFTFVRHPVSRAVSAFKDIFLERRNEAWTRHARYIERWSFSDSLEDSVNFDIFLEYVTESLHRDSNLTDPHFRRQVDNTGSNSIKFDFIGRVEDMDFSLGCLSSKLSFNIEALRMQTGKRANFSLIHFSPNIEQVLRLQEIYHLDFETFGYTFAEAI